MILKYELGDSQRKKYLFLPLAKLLIVIVVFTALSVYWFDTNTKDLFFVIGITWSWVSLIHLLPLIILAARHQKVSKGTTFVIDTTNREYHYKEGDFEVTFGQKQIIKVVKVVSPPKYDGRVDVLGFGYFYCWEITLVDDTILSMSCMLLDREEFFFEYRYEKKKQMFPLPKGVVKLTSFYN